MIAENREESTKQTIPIVRKIVSFFDRTLQARLPNHAVIAEGNDVSTVIPWERLLNSNFEAILSEADTVLKQFDMLPVFGKTVKVGAGRGPNTKIDWRIYPFIIMQRKVKGVIPTPVINDVLSQIPYKVNVLLSILPPGTTIKPHKGTSRAVIRCHLGLRIPQQSDKCFFVVDGYKYVWKANEALLFDDTYEHYAVNDTDEYRSLLIIDTVRPDLPFFGRWLAYVVTYILGFHKESRRVLRDYRKVLSALPKQES